MLHQVEAGLSGVVAQCAVVDTRLRAVRTVQLLQVLRRREEESTDVEMTFMNLMVKAVTTTLKSPKRFCYSTVFNHWYITNVFG